MAVAGGSFCQEHAPAPRDVRQPYRANYADPEYKRNRMKRYSLANGRCERCGRPVGKGEWQCDHIVEVARWSAFGMKGSPNQLSNLQVLCTVDPNRCHQTKTKNNRSPKSRR